MRHVIGFVCVLIVGTLGFAAPANALQTTYTFVYGSLEFRCTEAEFTAEFPELCPGGAPSELSVTFRHDQPIWDNEASGCDPNHNPDACDSSSFRDIVEVVASGLATFRGAEILDFQHADFLGPCPADDCGPAPYIHFNVRDDETGLEISVYDNEVFFYADYFFADGRRFEDGGAEWARGPTVPEPGTLTLFALGLAGLGVSRRRNAA